MTDRPRRPLSSDEMLEQFHNRVESGAAPRSSEDEVEPAVHRDATPPEPRSRRPVAPSPRAKKRPERPTARPPDPAVQKRLVLAVAVALGLVAFGLVAALMYAQGA